MRPETDVRETDLDLEPGFWLTVSMLLPLIVLVQVLSFFDDLYDRAKWRTP